MSESRGVLLFAHNNGSVRYDLLAFTCSWFVKKHLDVPVVLVTDDETLQHFHEDETHRFHGHEEWLIDDLILHSRDGMENGDRHHEPLNGGPKAPSMFLNKSRPDAYEITPFDETLLIDTDYILMNDRFSTVWGSDCPIRLNRHFHNVAHTVAAEKYRINEMTIPQYWATVMYFRKSPEAEAFFRLVQKIKMENNYYARVYRYASGLYRNDHAVSIAAHMMNGGGGENTPQWPVQSLPDPSLLFAWGDQPARKIDDDRIWFDGRASGDPKLYCPALVKGRSVHVMNKTSVLLNITKWVEDQLDE